MRCHNVEVSIHKLSSTNAFIAFDLDDAPAAGIVRSAPKILQGGAQDLARSLTYSFATFEMKRGGASAGINATPDERPAAVAAFVEELGPMVSEGRLALSAGKGVSDSDLAALLDADSRHQIATAAVGEDDLATHLAGLGPVVAASTVLSGLAGTRIAIEGFGAHGPALAQAATAQGATVVAVSTATGVRADSSGLDPHELRGEWGESGDALVGDDAEPAWKIFGAEADVLFLGSKMGAVNHETAAKLGVRAVVPHAPLPLTTRALAVLQRADIAVVPDFIATAAPLFAWWPSGDPAVDAVVATATAAIEEAINDTARHTDGGFLGACHRAEAFLGTWQDQLPFGRPLAS